MGRINNRLQRHGEEEVTAFDIPLEGISLDERELNSLTDDPRMHQRLYSAGLDGGLAKPTLGDFEPLQLREKLEGVSAELYVGMAEDVVRVSGTLTGVTLTAQDGGMTLLSAKLQIVPDIAKQAPLLLAFQGHEISVELHGGTKAEAAKGQEDLALPGAPAPEKPRRGRPRKADRLDA